MRARLAIPGQRYLGVSLIREIARPGAAILSRVRGEMSFHENGEEQFDREEEYWTLLPTNLGETAEFEYTS